MDRRHGLSKSEGLTAAQGSVQSELELSLQVLGLSLALSASGCIGVQLFSPGEVCLLHWAQCNTCTLEAACPSLFQQSEHTASEYLSSVSDGAI